MRAHTEVSVSDRIEDLFYARPWTQTVLWADEVIIVWKTNPPWKRGRLCGTRHVHGDASRQCVVNMRGSLWQSWYSSLLP